MKFDNQSYDETDNAKELDTAIQHDTLAAFPNRDQHLVTCSALSIYCPLLDPSQELGRIIQLTIQ